MPVSATTLGAAPLAAHALLAALPPQLVQRDAAGDVGKFLHDCLQPAVGKLVEVGDVYGTYRTWCRRQQAEPVATDVFADRFAKICGDIGVQMRVKGKKVFCVNIAVNP